MGGLQSPGRSLLISLGGQSQSQLEGSGKWTLYCVLILVTRNKTDRKIHLWRLGVNLAGMFGRICALLLMIELDIFIYA